LHRFPQCPLSDISAVALDLNVRRWIPFNISRTFAGHERRLSDDEV
jgi:hypothetical protein